MATPETRFIKDGMNFHPDTSGGRLVFPGKHFTLSQPKDDPLLEEKRRIVSGVQEVTPYNWRVFNEYVSAYFEVLKDPENRIHFVGVPDTLEEFKMDLKAKGSHPLVATNELGEVVAFAVIKDPARGELDGTLGKFVVLNNLQNTTKVDGESEQQAKPRGVGRQAMGMVFDWSFNNMTEDGNKRKRIDAFVMVTADKGRREIPNWTRMYSLLVDAGGEVVYYNPDTAQVPFEGKNFSGDSIRVKVTEEAWKQNRHKFVSSN